MLTATQKSDLTQAIARGCPPHERAACASADQSDWPEWARSLAGVLEALSTEPVTRPSGSSATESNAIESPFARMLDFERAWLTHVIDGHHLSVSGDAIGRIVELLSARLAAASLGSFDAEARIQLTLAGQFGRAGEIDTTAEGWLTRFDRYPVLAYVVSIVRLHWRSYVAELFARLSRDRALLETRFFRGAPLGELTDFYGDAGDVHDGGRSVAILRFGEGRRVVYKPKDLRIGAAFMEIVAFLNAEGLDPPLHTRLIVPRDGYAWEEYVDAAPCGSRGDVERFYVRIGMMLRLLQLLEGRDFWFDNLIAHGEQPVFVDLEMLLQPRVRLRLPLSTAEKAALDRIEESTANIGIVALPVPIQGCSEDFGALTPPRDFLTPYRMTPSIIGRLPERRRVDDQGRVLWTYAAHAPIFNRAPVRATDFFEEIVSGYTRMHERLRASAAALDGFVRGMATFPVRYIARDTFSCYQIIHASTAAQLLIDGERRERFLARIGASAKSSHDSANRSIAERETEAFRRLDVPLLHSLPGESVLLTEGVRVAEAFDGNAVDRVRRRLATIDCVDIDEQVDVIKSVFSTGRHGGRAVDPALARAVRTGHRSNGSEWIQRAIEIGDFVLAQATRGDRGEMAWIGIAYFPTCDLRRFAPLRPELLSGTCGLAVLFADLYTTTGLERFREGCLGALEGSVRALARVPAALEQLARKPEAQSAITDLLGGFYGAGAQLYTIRRCGEVAREGAARDAAEAFLHALPMVVPLLPRLPCDLACGSPGLLLAILPEAERPLQQVDAAVLAIIEHLRAHRSEAVHLPRPGVRVGTPLASLPGGDYGLDMTLWRLSGVKPSLTCGNLPGDLLGALELATALGGAEGQLLDAVSRYVSADSESTTSSEALDNLEIALAAFRATGDEGFIARARVWATRLACGRDACGSWFPERWSADRHELSAITGVTAVAHALLALASDGSVASPRLLA